MTDSPIIEAKEPPYSVNRGQKIVGDLLLTNVEWHPSNWWGGDYGQPETGVRRMEGDKAVEGSFLLIQHGWWNFDFANEVIVKALEKGWDDCRTHDLMRWMLERWPSRCHRYKHEGRTDD